jgi:REP element-mobilizing transposase RayT
MKPIWYHFMFTAFGAWIRGDPRGFRDHDHRIHCPGDYKNPPKPGAFHGLRSWVLRNMHKDAVRLSRSNQRCVSAVIVNELLARDVRLLCLAVMPDHVHGLGQFDVVSAAKTIGLAKAQSSRAIRAQVPGIVWGKRARLKEIRDRNHQVETFRYICEHECEGAVVWTFREASPLEENELL